MLPTKCRQGMPHLTDAHSSMHANVKENMPTTCRSLSTHLHPMQAHIRHMWLEDIKHTNL